MKNKLIESMLFAFGTFLLSSSAGAENTHCPSPAPRVLRGWTAQASVGPAFWTGKMGQASKPGIAFQLGTGYDLASWLSLTLLWSLGIHTTNQPHPPFQGTFATHAVHTGVKLGWPIGRFDISLLGGIGFWWSRPDILVRIPEFDGSVRLGWIGGVSFIWHTSRRRVWLGIQANAMGSDSFPDIWIVGSGIIGVTL